jgi:hypothetical protein
MDLIAAAISKAALHASARATGRIRQDDDCSGQEQTGSGTNMIRNKQDQLYRAAFWNVADTVDLKSTGY